MQEKESSRRRDKQRDEEVKAQAYLKNCIPELRSQLLGRFEHKYFYEHFHENKTEIEQTQHTKSKHFPAAVFPIFQRCTAQ